MTISIGIKGDKQYLSEIKVNGNNVFEQYSITNCERLSMQVEKGECEIFLSFYINSPIQIKRKINSALVNGVFGIVEYDMKDAVNNTQKVCVRVWLTLDKSESTIDFDTQGNVLDTTAEIKNIITEKKIDNKLLQSVKIRFFLPIAILAIILTVVFGICGYYAIGSGQVFIGVFTWLVAAMLDALVVAAYIRAFLQS